MTVTVADIEFDRVEYDADADVLYLHIGHPSRAVDHDETPEGNAVRFDRGGDLVGLTLVRSKRLLNARGTARHDASDKNRVRGRTRTRAERRSTAPMRPSPPLRLRP